MKTFFASFTILLLLGTALISEENVDQSKTHQTQNQNSEVLQSASQVRFILPINWTVSPKENLNVIIPEGFHSLQSLDEISEESIVNVEFVPEGETGEDWNEIITASKFIGKGLTASGLTSSLKKAILGRGENGKVWKEKTDNSPNYQTSILGLAYDFQSRREVMAAQYFSGPHDCVGVQYSIRLGKEMSEEQAVKKIENFFRSNISIPRN